jgi:outer membrane protein assembly factor BamA
VLNRLFTVGLFLALLGLSPAQTRSTPRSPAALTVHVRNVVFHNAGLLSPQEQDQIAAKLKDEDPKSGEERDAQGIASEAKEHVASFYQDQGYFKVEVTAKVIPATGGHLKGQADVDIRVVNEGQRYWLQDIRWIGMTAFSEEQLLSLTPIRPGEILSRSKIADALDSVRIVYEADGYVEFTSIPSTEIDDNTSGITLRIEIREGEQFRMGQFDIKGVEPATREQLLRAWPLKPGDVFNGDAVSRFLLDNYHLMPDARIKYSKRLDREKRSVDYAISFDPQDPIPTRH